jgi:hypothetical protein
MYFFMAGIVVQGQSSAASTGKAIEESVDLAIEISGVQACAGENKPDVTPIGR